MSCLIHELRRVLIDSEVFGTGTRGQLLIWITAESGTTPRQCRITTIPPAKEVAGSDFMAATVRTLDVQKAAVAGVKSMGIYEEMGFFGFAGVKEKKELWPTFVVLSSFCLHAYLLDKSRSECAS